MMVSDRCTKGNAKKVSERSMLQREGETRREVLRWRSREKNLAMNNVLNQKIFTTRFLEPQVASRHSFWQRLTYKKSTVLKMTKSRNERLKQQKVQQLRLGINYIL